jgi:hypothetical protein
MDINLTEVHSTLLTARAYGLRFQFKTHTRNLLRASFRLPKLRINYWTLQEGMLFLLCEIGNTRGKDFLPTKVFSLSKVNILPLVYLKLKFRTDNRIET